MATVTIHQWPDADRGLREMRRVARGPVVILTFDGDALDRLCPGEEVRQRPAPPESTLAVAASGSLDP